MYHLRSFIAFIALSLMTAVASAHLTADKLVINKTTGKAVITVNFPVPVKGDLYLAVGFDGHLLFYSDSGKMLSPKVAPFLANTSFTNSFPVLTVSSEGIPPGKYPVYQVVTKPSTDPFEVTNWIGGFAGLSSLELSINLPVEVAGSTKLPITTPTSGGVPDKTSELTSSGCQLLKLLAKSQLEQRSSREEAEDKEDEENEDDRDDHSDGSEVKPSPTTVPVPVVTTTPKVDDKLSKEEQSSSVSCPAPTTPSALAITGKTVYRNICSSCHGTNPAANQNNVMKGRDVVKIREAIKSDKGGLMGALAGNVKDADLIAVAEFLKTQK